MCTARILIHPFLSFFPGSQYVFYNCFCFYFRFFLVSDGWLGQDWRSSSKWNLNLPENSFFSHTNKNKKYYLLSSTETKSLLPLQYRLVKDLYVSVRWCKIVEIERLTLRAAILVSNKPKGFPELVSLAAVFVLSRNSPLQQRYVTR